MKIIIFKLYYELLNITYEWVHQIMNLSNIWNEFERYTYSIGEATARVRTLPPFLRIWHETHPKLWCTNSYKLDPTIFFNHGWWRRLNCKTSPMDWFDTLNNYLPRSIHEVVWLSWIHGWWSSLVLITFPVSAKTIPSPSPYITIICPLLTPFSTVL